MSFIVCWVVGATTRPGAVNLIWRGMRAQTLPLDAFTFLKEMVMDKDTRVNTNCGPSSGRPQASPVDDDQGVIVAGAAARAAARPVEPGAGTACAAGVGGAADSAAAEVIDPTGEDAYWRDNFAGRSYVEQGASFGDYGPAYGFGVTSYGRYPGRSFEDVESEMSGSWSASRGGSSLSWERAKQAVRDAWNRISGSA